MLDLKFGGPRLQFSYSFLAGSPGGGHELNSLAMPCEEPNGQPSTSTCELSKHFCSIRNICLCCPQLAVLSSTSRLIMYEWINFFFCIIFILARKWRSGLCHKQQHSSSRATCRARYLWVTTWRTGRQTFHPRRGGGTDPHSKHTGQSWAAANLSAS